MKLNRIIAVFLCLTAVLSFTACKYRLKEPEYELGNIEGVTLETKGDITSTGGTFIFKNETDKEIGYGYDYRLQMYKDGEWMDMYAPFDIPAVMLILSPESELSLLVDWSKTHGNLKSGKYRLIKGCFYDADPPEILVHCEFEIK